MKKLLFIVVAIATTMVVYSQEQHPENCPLGGRDDCTGYCGEFNDNNGDGFCDFATLSSQKQKKDNKTEKSINENKNQKSPKAKTNSQKDKSTSQTNKIISETDKIVNETNPTVTDTISVVNNTEKSATQNATPITIERPHKTQQHYHFWSFCLITIILYLVSVMMVKTKRITKITHRKIWNIVLLITCLVSCLIGMYVVLAKMYGWNMNYMELMKWHVNVGIAMTIVAIIHIFWHLKYWKNLFKLLKNTSD